MAPQKSTKKPATSAPGVKVLITATSLAATLGGWALISSTAAQPVAPAVPSTPSLAASANSQGAASTITIKLAPLPTLVPETAPQTQLVTVNQSRRAAAQQIAPQPAQTTLVLRDVSAPAQASGGVSAPGAAAPAPVVNTKSSR